MPLDAETWRHEARAALARPRGDGRLGALVVAFAYEAGAWTERMPAPSTPPPLGLCRAGRVVAWSPVATAAGLPGSEARGRRRPDDDRGRYEAGVRRILDHLRAGDAYQVNLCRSIRVDAPPPPPVAWARLRAANPARRGVLLEWPDGALVCNSPELLLHVRGGRALSVPIKGTAALHTPATALLRSAKERAELTMIVDLVRADLGRVARPGGVRAGPRRVGRVGHVWHAMQRVHAELDAGRDAVDAFAAVFPPGSVTGAPKVRAMELVRALEAEPRGFYCGAVGYFAPGGEAWFNVAIRTITYAAGEARVQVGAGIVVGSDPAREYDETELKARRMLEALT